ncbi:ComEC/Rec2 family competence protein [Tropicimonas sp. IMCC6043]|uniref:ComEC/Rec2 family competence protein n=1 Tax=Tropicimonas sp. IMCC6043 TaxID=2510645 RepID=UPI00101B772E|nr:ComEC/Rec2 family competence protein [Tropicimonas sp. IMCC6043]RYH10153.1 ComEC family competence protein [Tropicimonas sp. IMCC6043]
MAETSPHSAATRRHWFADALLAQRGSLILFVPICLATGIAIWFGLRAEPGEIVYWTAAACAALLLLLGLLAGDAVAPLFWAAALVLCGLLLAGGRAHSVAEPILSFRYYGPIQGRIVDIDRSGSDKIRFTLDQVVLEDMRPERVPARVRVSLHGAQNHMSPEPGLTVILTGHLLPPNGPVEPGGFDFRRLAFFERLGAVGYTRTPVLVLAPAEEGKAGLTIFRLRMALSQWVQSRIPGDAGAFAAAIMTGDRSAMPFPALDSLRRSNLAHLLAISGLHMGLLTGVVFSALRAALALIPWLALRAPIRKIAALGALAVGAAYLALSGGAVSTERAFVMVSVMLVAILLDRRAISLRSVAIAATIILIRTPEALFSAGFQMSFAATTALVAAFGLLRDHRARLPRSARWLAPALAVCLSSAVAGVATAPFAAAHFNRIADYGLVANLLSVPLMGTVVMPAAVATALLWPVGLSAIPLWVMACGLEWILGVAGWISGLEGSVTHVVAPGPAVLPLLSLGILWLVAWKGRGRWLGPPLMLAALLAWGRADRPDILIADSGGLVGIASPAGRVLSRPSGDGFAAATWLENDGESVNQTEAAGRPGFVGGQYDRVADLNGLSIRLLRGKTGAAAVESACGADILVTNIDLPDGHAADCVLFNPARLRETGAVAIWTDSTPPRILTAADIGGDRLWTR